METQWGVHPIYETWRLTYIRSTANDFLYNLSMRKKILVLIPDKLVHATGGMGENMTPILKILSNIYDFYVVGFPASADEIPKFLKGYIGFQNPFPNVQFSPISCLNVQLECFCAALGFPKPDLILAYDWSVYFPAVRLQKHYRVPLAVEMCLSPIMLSRDGFDYGLDLEAAASREIHHTFCEMEKTGLFEADRIVQISNGYARRFSEVAAFGAKTRIVPMCIDFEKWRGPVEQYELPGTRPHKIIFIGRFVENKGILQLCKARIPDAIDLIFIGAKETASKSCMDAIHEMVKNNHNVHYIGPLYGEDKIRALRSADGLIVPSLHEPFGIVGLEGLASECIVLSSRADGLGDFLTDRTSVSCGRDPLSIERAYERFLKMGEQAKREMKKNGLDVCQGYSAENVAESLKNVFIDLL